MKIFKTSGNADCKISYESLLKTFLQNYPGALWLKNKNLEFVGGNEFYYKYFSSDPIKDKIHKEIKEAEAQIIKDRASKTFSVHISDNRILSVTAIPVLKNDSIENIVYISRNITEQEKLKERFFINKYQLNAFLENVPKIIYMKDLEGNYVTGTKHSEVFFKSGYDYLNEIQLDFSECTSINADEDKFVIENNKSLSSDKEVFDTKGIPHYYKIYRAPINDYNRNVIGIVVIAKNIDEEKLLEAQRETFVASLGHDLKNPTLAQIRAIELLLKGEFGNVTDKQGEILAMVLESCRYMNAMLGSLLATYRNERGVVKLNYMPVSLSELTTECIGEMIYLAKDKGVNISVDNDCSNPVVFADKVQIKRVVMNLLSNGIKYAYKNSTIKIKIFNEQDCTCFQFENNSPYISEEKQEAIFAQYVSFAGAHKELGIGLGLYASKKIVNAHGGRIFVKSYEDNRNIFGFKIPNLKDSVCSSKTVSF